MDAAQWPQEIEFVNNIEGSSTAPNTCTQPLLGERRAKPEKDQALNCPRCNSTNTKFCYYNNYSLTQPRYFCKTCRRYWTEGGTLRNVPVGGGSRKNKRSSSSSPSSAMITASSSKVHHDLNPPTTTLSHLIPPSQNPKISLEGQHTLEFSFPTTQNYLHGNVTQFFESLPKIENNKSNHVRSSSALELLRSTGIASRGLNNNSYITMPVMPDSYSSGFPILHELKPTLSFSFEGMKSGNGNFQGIHQGNNGNGRLLFPFGEVKQLSSGTNEVDHQNKGQSNSTGYNNWNGMFGGGSW